MKRTALLLLALSSLPSLACSHPGLDCEKLADAIYRAEGGTRARSPYGVLSVKVKDAADARRVTLNSIHNNWRRLSTINSQPSTPVFIDFMADRWCPVAADPQGNRNWKRNVKALYAK